MTEIYIFGAIATFVIASYFYSKNKREQIEAKSKQDHDLHELLIDLTDCMKKICERPDTNFDQWAALNDDILECATNYYNGATIDQQEKYDTVVDFVSTSAKKVDEIASSSDHEHLLIAFSSEIKTNKLSQQGSR